MSRGRYFQGFWRITGSLAGVVCNPLLRRILPQAGQPPVIRHVTLSTHWWPKKLDGYRIAFASDLHLNDDACARRQLAAAVDRLLEIHPDLIVLGGDLVNAVFPATNLPAEEYAAQLARLTAPDGVCAVYGNHDVRLGAGRTRYILKRAGIRILKNRNLRIDSRLGGSFRLAGFADPPPRRAAVRRIVNRKNREIPVIAVCHQPEIFPKLPRQARLLLAGHTHGGQVRLPGIGPVVAGTALGRKLNYGVIRDGGKTMIVTGGVGSANLALRIGCPPEVLSITLKGDA